MNKGYAKRVIEATAQAAVAAGCTCLVADATNVVSQHLLPLFGYAPIKKVTREGGRAVLQWAMKGRRDTVCLVLMCQHVAANT